MPRFFALLVSVVLFILGVTFVLVQILRFLGISRMSRGRRLREQRLILDQLRSENRDLAPWKKSEIDLLSSKVEWKVRRKFFSRWLEGHIQTIYSETIAPFAARIYGERQYICGVMTDHGNYTLMGLGKLTEAYVGDRKVGDIKDGQLVQNGKTLAQLRKNIGSYDAIVVNGKDTGHIKSQGQQDGRLVTERVLEVVLEENISTEDLPLFTIMVLYSMLGPVVREAA